MKLKQGYSARTFDFEDKIWKELKDLHKKLKSFDGLFLKDRIHSAILNLIKDMRREYVEKIK